MVEIPLRLHAVAGVVQRPPELFVLVGADAAEQRGESAAEMRHVDGQGRIAVEHAGVDQPDRGHHEGKFAADRTRHLVCRLLLEKKKIQRGVQEKKKENHRELMPERLEFISIQLTAVRLIGDYNAV